MTAGFSFLESAHEAPREPVALRTEVFSAAEILAANQRHDRHYGFSTQNCHCYTNLLRFPESVLGELDWDQ